MPSVLRKPLSPATDGEEDEDERAAGDRRELGASDQAPQRADIADARGCLRRGGWGGGGGHQWIPFELSVMMSAALLASTKSGPDGTAVTGRSRHSEYVTRLMTDM